MFAPLTGVKVIDLTHVLAGPYCTQMLAMLGAEVIKIEPPGSGEPIRYGGPVPELNRQGLGLAFLTQNADKATVTVDLKQPEGVEIVRRLVAEAAVFVENYRPGVADRLGVGFDDLVAVQPELVYVSLTAYGQTGPLGHRPAYDHVVQAMSGIMETTGTDETGPVKVGAPVVDYATGAKGALATVAAVMEQRRTGEPQRVDTAMLDTTLLLMASTLCATATTGDRPAKLGNEAASLAPSSGTFETADGLLALAANNQRQVTDLCDAVGHPEWAGDQRFSTPQALKTNAESFRALLNAVLATRTAAQWEATFDRVGVPASRVRSLDQLLDEGHPAARGLVTELEVADTTVRLPTAGFAVNGEVPGPRRAPRPVGADTESVLTGLGYGPDDIERLRADDVI